VAPAARVGFYPFNQRRLGINNQLIFPFFDIFRSRVNRRQGQGYLYLLRPLILSLGTPLFKELVGNGPFVSASHRYLLSSSSAHCPISSIIGYRFSDTIPIPPGPVVGFTVPSRIAPNEVHLFLLMAFRSIIFRAYPDCPGLVQHQPKRRVSGSDSTLFSSSNRN